MPRSLLFAQLWSKWKATRWLAPPLALMESAALSEQSTLKTGLPPLHPISTQESKWEGRALPGAPGSSGEAGGERA